jgi:urease accessory protein
MADSENRWLASLLQYVDPLFPSGAYAHSLGLEQMIELGVVTAPDDLAAYVREHVYPGARELDLPAARFAWTATSQAEYDDLGPLGGEVWAARLPLELREAGRAIGTRRMELLRKLHRWPALEALAEYCEHSPQAGQHVVVHGIQCACAGIPLRATLDSLIYQSVAAVLVASTKLLRMGQEKSQELLTQLLGDAATVVEASLVVARDNMGAFTPLLDIASARHEIAFSRLFIS